MKKIIKFGKPLLLILCVISIMLVSGCGGTIEGAVASITNYSTTIPRDMQAPATARFVSFHIESESERFGYQIGFATVVNGIRNDTILYTFGPFTQSEFASVYCSVLIMGNFFSENVSFIHRQHGDGWSYVSDQIVVYLPELSGYNLLNRSSYFEHILLEGEDLVVAGAIGSVDGEVLRPITLDVFDNFRTIDDALNSHHFEYRPFLLIFFISAI
jgi:hypothetical protein